MNILLTGATGFLGSHLLKAIINKTDYNVIVLKRSFSSIKRIADYLDNTRISYYDIDRSPIEDVFKENNISVIIHCATNYGRGHNSSYDVLQTNLMLPVKLLDLATEYGVETFLNTDSYFNKENMSYSYLLNYSLSKKSLLLWLKYFSNRLKIANMVLEHLYGEDDNPDKFVYKILNSIAVNQDKSLDLTFGDQRRDFVYIDDVVEAYIAVLKYSEKTNFRFKSFDVGTGKAISIKDFVQEVKNISHSSTILNFGALPYREDEIMCSCADIVDLKNIGWEPKYSCHQALSKIIKELV